jgi:hypothetical protein
MENVTLCHVSSCDVVHNDGPVSQLSPSVRVVEKTDFLTENFKTKFSE